MIYPKLTIEHNHGVLILKDATIVDGTAKGEVLGGGQTSRLFWATQTRNFPVGKQMSWPVYGRKPYQEADGAWRVSCVFCG